MQVIHKKKKPPAQMTIQELLAYVREIETENKRLEESFQRATGEIAADPLPGAKTITRAQFKQSAKQIGSARGNTSEKVFCAFFAVDLEIALFGDYEEDGGAEQ